MYEKFKITGTIEVVSGLHIGGLCSMTGLQNLDEYVVRDVWTDLPMIPGSSLKGKLRTLLSMWMNAGKLPCDPADDPWQIKKLFGHSCRDENGRIPKGRLQFCDMYITEESLAKLEEKSILSPTEVKVETAINRLTMQTETRQIERVIRGVEFGLDIIYNAEFEDGNSARQKEINEEIQKDFETLRVGFDLLERDYLGGKGTRGYGRVLLHDLSVDLIFGSSSVAVYNKILNTEKERK